MKVFQVDEATWMVGDDGPSCVAAYIKDYDGEPEVIEDFGEPIELSSEDLERLEFFDLDDSSTRTFAEELVRTIAESGDFPRMFASTEF